MAEESSESVSAATKAANEIRVTGSYGQVLALHGYSHNEHKKTDADHSTDPDWTNGCTHS